MHAPSANLHSQDLQAYRIFTFLRLSLSSLSSSLRSPDLRSPRSPGRPLAEREVIASLVLHCVQRLGGLWRFSLSTNPRPRVLHLESRVLYSYLRTQARPIPSVRLAARRQDAGRHSLEGQYINLIQSKPSFPRTWAAPGVYCPPTLPQNRAPENFEMCEALYIHSLINSPTDISLPYLTTP